MQAQLNCEPEFHRSILVRGSKIQEWELKITSSFLSTRQGNSKFLLKISETPSAIKQNLAISYGKEPADRQI